MQKTQKNIFKVLFLGRSSSEIRQEVQLFLEQNFDSLIYPPAVQRLHAAQLRGEYTVILSTGPDFLVEAFAQRFTVSDWQATHYSINQLGNLAFISHLFEGKDKAFYIKMLAKKLSLPFSAITFYSDSFLDLAAMQMAGVAVAVSPDKKLRRICLEKGWEIL